MTAPDTDHAVKIREMTDSIRLRVIAYPDCGGALVPNHLDDIERHTDALQADRDAAREALAAERARHTRIVGRIMEVYAAPGDCREDVEYALALSPMDLYVEDEGEVTT